MLHSFFLHNVSLGDIVRAPGYLFESVKISSGRYVFRAFFEGGQHEWRRQTIEALHQSDVMTKWYSEGLLAVDAENEHSASMVAAFLVECQDRGYLTFETGHM